MLGRLTALGYGPDRVVPIAFHVDYFNDPWKDPFSDPSYSQREMAYNGALKRNDLYFTPMMMIDGRYPMLGSDQPKAQAALKRAVKEPPGARLDVELGKGVGKGRAENSLAVTVAALSPSVADRDLLVGVALYEDPVKTKVASGENAGKTLVEHYAVRQFQYQKTRLESRAPQTFNFSVAPPLDANAGRCGLAVFVQDWNSGQIYQADAVPWVKGRTGE